jgi:hypothetical protein
VPTGQARNADSGRTPGWAAERDGAPGDFKWWYLMFWISKWRRHYTIERETLAAVDVGGEG